MVHALIFTAVYSRHMFVWLTFAQTLAAVIAGCEAAWGFFGGVFKVLIPDNLKPIVAHADAVNPRFTVGWLDYAQARGFVTDPARVRSAGQARVERVVQYVRGNFFAGEDFVDLDRRPGPRRDVVRRARPGQRIHGTTARARRSVRRARGAGAAAGPRHRYDVPIFVEVKVHRDYHVEIARSLYSVPEHLIGQRIEARADASW